MSVHVAAGTGGGGERAGAPPASFVSRHSSSEETMRLAEGAFHNGLFK